MRTWIIGIAAMLYLVMMSGCATIMHGKYQDIPITSEPSGATVTATSGQKIATPGTMMLIRNKPVILKAELEGYEPAEQKLSPKVAGWFFGNILAGGIIGGAIDHSSGAGSDLVPHDVHFNLVPIKETEQLVSSVTPVLGIRHSAFIAE